MKPTTLIVVLAAAAIAGFLAFLPGIVARKRRHRNASAINVCGLVGFFIWPAWVVAIIWAHTDNTLPEPSRPAGRRKMTPGAAADALRDMGEPPTE